MKTKRAYLTAPGKIELREIEIFPKADQVLVKLEVCGLCNYELNHWKGVLGQCPQTLGHEWAGIVVELGPDVKKLNVGDRVSGLPEGLVGFSEYITASEINCFKIAPHINLRYALVEPLKCVTTVLRATAPEAADHAVIQGCGPMGLWCIQALSGHFLGSIIALDIDDDKLKLAKKYGATHLINSGKEETEHVIEDITKGYMADFLIDGTGIPSLFNSAQSYLKKSGRGRLVLMSSHKESCKEFDFREAIARSLQIIVAHPAYSIDKTDDFRRAVDYLNNDVYKVQELVSHEFKLDDIQTAFETLDQKPAGYLKGIVTIN